MNEGFEGHPDGAACADEPAGPTTAEPVSSTSDAGTLKSAEADESAADTAVGPFIVLGDAGSGTCGPDGCCQG